LTGIDLGAMQKGQEEKESEGRANNAGFEAG